MRQSSFQKAQRAVLRNQLWINVALFRACAAGEPDPTSERSLPVPYEGLLATPSHRNAGRSL